MNEVFNEDCMVGMARYPDNYFELAIVDPPYGNDNITGGYTSGKGGGVAKQKNYNKALWTQLAPENVYFNELFRVSKNQIIWGANHLVNFINVSSGWVFWDKLNGDVSFSDGELAYTSFNKGLRKFSFRWSGMLQGDMKNKEHRIHPTQKPVKLYEWLLMNYAKEGDKILDTHLGSGSSRIAAYKLGFDFVGFELDKDYFEASEKRFKEVTSQLTIF
jgi:site-specific DNA-methyltransferase (adenine-specific)